VLAGDEVKVKIELGGIFLSDLGVYLGNIGHAVYPVRTGYELICTIVEAGPTSSYPTGTRVNSSLVLLKFYRFLSGEKPH
jgi:threonine dehydrogenase-like Zn-dependent dehydrogenase